MKKDIENRADIELLVNTFYEKVKADKQLGFIFEEIAQINWSAHLPAMCNFWENILFYTGSYTGNPMNLHKHLDQITRLNDANFDQWNKLFLGTVNELFEGEKAEMAGSRAISISKIIKQKLSDHRKGDTASDL
ncbi:group III truncated hemoglobin [Daejeonella oryzae]|uniref:group III truncated hemoglobin n=1 Tax=Daejeonella oryzae TaxID=1122943 RepID=UPI00041E404B|nr:group III truncated hemoglobin [Daejeonella oryzae]